jgi:hypothetical protein
VEETDGQRANAPHCCDLHLGLRNVRSGAVSRPSGGKKGGLSCSHLQISGRAGVTFGDSTPFSARHPQRFETRRDRRHPSASRRDPYRPQTRLGRRQFPLPCCRWSGIAARPARPTSPRRIAFRNKDEPTRGSATGRVFDGTKPPSSIAALPNRENGSRTHVDPRGNHTANTIAYAGTTPKNCRICCALAERNSDEGKCKPCPQRRTANGKGGSGTAEVRARGQRGHRPARGPTHPW